MRQPRAPAVARLVLAAMLANQVSCANHPALTVGVAAGSVGLLSCEIQGASQGTCGIITGIAAVGLGGLAWLVTHFADTSAHQLPDDDELLTDGTVRLHTHTALPPVPLASPPDAGVTDPAGVDATVQPVQPVQPVPGSGAPAGQSPGGPAAAPSS